MAACAKLLAMNIETKIYFVSDLHFQHTNLVAGCSKWTDKAGCRPFASVNEHDETLISNWNKVVTPNDIVYNLGDFCFGRVGMIAERYLRRLNFKEMFYIFGNHDEAMEDLFKTHGDHYLMDGIKTIHNCGHYREINLPVVFKAHQFMVLCHYAMIEWNRKHKDAIMLYGHSHGHINNWVAKHMPDDKLMDVGMECINYTPISFEEVLQKMVHKKCGTHHEANKSN